MEAVLRRGSFPRAASERPGPMRALLSHAATRSRSIVLVVKVNMELCGVTEEAAPERLTAD